MGTFSANRSIGLNSATPVLSLGSNEAKSAIPALAGDLQPRKGGRLGVGPAILPRKTSHILSMTSSRNISCRLERRAEYQGSRPSVLRQAEVEKYVTGSGNLSLPSKSVTRTNPELSVHNIKTLMI